MLEDPSWGLPGHRFVICNNLNTPVPNSLYKTFD